MNFSVSVLTFYVTATFGCRAASSRKSWMIMRGKVRFLIAILAAAVVSGFQGRWSSLARSMLRIGSRDRLEMANAFASPSVITRQKVDEVMNDPFASPSALINGGAGNENCK